MHRERVISSVPLVDSRLKTYSFMENQSWKKHAEKYRVSNHLSLRFTHLRRFVPYQGTSTTQEQRNRL